MSDNKVVGAEEARRLVESSHEDGDFAEASEVLLRTVIALHARVEEVEAERDSARIRGINGERERIVSCIEKVIGSSVTDGGMYLADIESALNAWADALWEKIVAERDEARRQRDRLVRVIAVSRGKVAP